MTTQKQTNTPWTPGPWKVRNTGTSTAVFGRHGTEQVHCERNDSQSASNAQLIALAPEMAEALADLACFIDSLKWGETYAGRPHAIMDKARAILARLPQKGGE